MRRWFSVVFAAVFCAQAARGGAWTLPRGSVEVYSGAAVSQASQRYDGKGNLVGPAPFKKLYVQNWFEYGLTDALTVFAAPQYVIAEVNGHSIGASSAEIGGRLLVTKRIGVVSLQASAKSAGAFNMSTSASGQSGSQWELRLLYGTSFKLWRRDAFIDIEVAKRWLKRPRPDELVADVTFGLWTSRKDMILLQSFADISTGAALRPYEPFRQFKLEASLVHSFTPHWSIQSGYFFTWAGRNTVKESGFAGTIWWKT